MHDENLPLYCNEVILQGHTRHGSAWIRWVRTGDISLEHCEENLHSVLQVLPSFGLRGGKNLRQTFHVSPPSVTQVRADPSSLSRPVGSWKSRSCTVSRFQAVLSLSGRVPPKDEDTIMPTDSDRLQVGRTLELKSVDLGRLPFPIFFFA